MSIRIGVRDPIASEVLQIGEQCRNCKYWRRWEPTLVHPTPHIVGDCRLGGPSIFETPIQGGPATKLVTKWPSTKEGEWCGKWRIAPSPAMPEAEREAAKAAAEACKL